MTKYIVYKSNSGFTKKYAELLANELGISAINYSDMEEIEKDSDIIFMGWIMASKIQGLSKAQKKFNINAICSVGMAPPSEKITNEIFANNNVEENKFFYLQGGFDMQKLKGIYKILMQIMEKVIRKKLSKNKGEDEELSYMLDMLENGMDCVSIENLKPLLDSLR
ncbi:MAG: flavodoxin domain-containing protein [Clostridia bacterium]|nr:flavodoxin domain-containing protein [Clostridia bacterium]